MTEKNKAAQELGRLGGKARAARLSQSERSQCASDAVSAYWERLTPEQRTTEMKRRAKKRKDAKEKA